MGNYNRLLQDFALRCGLPEIQHNSYSRGQELWKKKTSLPRSKSQHPGAYRPGTSSLSEDLNTSIDPQLLKMEVSIMCVDLQSLLHLNSGLQLVTAFSCPGRKGGIHHKIIYIYIELHFGTRKPSNLALQSFY